MVVPVLLSRRRMLAGMGIGMILGTTGRAAAQEAWTAPAVEKVRKSPLPAGQKTVEQGRRVAAANCVTCHGASGKGDGAAAMMLSPKPTDWTSKKVQDDTDGGLFWKITSGRGSMPPWRHLPESDRWALVHYLRSLKR